MTRKEEIQHYKNVIQDISHKIDEIHQRANDVNPDLFDEFSVGVSNIVKLRTKLENDLSTLENVSEEEWILARNSFKAEVKNLKIEFQKLFEGLSS